MEHSLERIPWKRAWDYVWETLYRNGMFYDFRTALTPDGATKDLPSPEEIARQIPNPCGWNTGMENGAMYCGVMLYACGCIYQFTGERPAETERLIAMARTLSTISGIRGFSARTVAPDGKSFYADSSRDQYTHMIYGICRFLDSGAATAEEARELTDYVVSYAEYAEKCMSAPENQHFLLRADGVKGIVSRMWDDIHPHEYMRLPMFYLCAHHLSGDAHWLERYQQLRDDALERSWFEPSRWENMSCFGARQMQYSVRLCCDYEPDEAYKARYRALGDHVAEVIAQLAKKRELAEQMAQAVLSGRKFDLLYPAWRDMPMKYLRYAMVTGGREPYFMPEFGADVAANQHLLDEVTAAITAIAISPGEKNTVPQELIRALADIFTCIDFAAHTSSEAFFFIENYWDLRTAEARNCRK